MKFAMMIARRCCFLVMVVSFFCLSIQSVSAQFVKIDNFDGLSLGVLGGQNNGSGTWVADAGFDVIVDPTSAGNQVMLAPTADPGINAVLNDPKINIADGTTGTFFARYYRGDAASHVNFGLSDLVDPVPDSWSGFESQLRDQDSQMDVRDGGGFTSIDNVPLEPENEWINLWIVANNDTDTNEYYVQSATTYPTQTKLSSGGKDVFAFRNGTSDPLQSFYLRAFPPHAGPWYLDDVYLDSAGANLANPVPEPATGLLTILGAFGLLGFSRRIIAQSVTR